jgi:5-methylcytosine-specific restriction protein A
MQAKWIKGRDHGRIAGRALQALRKRILDAEPLCRNCASNGRVCAAIEIDHITPLSKGGTYDDNNLQPLCVPCHEAKTAKDCGRTLRPKIGLDGYPISKGA